MDAKVTLSFNAAVIEQAKALAEKQGISLSRLTEILLRKAIDSQNYHIEELPVADWVSQVAEGEIEYVSRRKKRSDAKDEFFKSRKK